MKLKNEGFLTASNVQYVGKGANLYEMGFKYSGQFEALKGLLRTGFLWDKVRVHGGAYGSSNSFDFLTGDYGLVSYRDPNLCVKEKSGSSLVRFLWPLVSSTLIIPI